MNVLLLSGLGPTWPQASAFYDSKILNETFLDKKVYHSGLKAFLSIDDFYFIKDGKKNNLFRKRNDIEKNLTTATLENIMESNDISFESFDLANIWDNLNIQVKQKADIIFLSTTFICNFKDLEFALKWIHKNFHNIPIALGGQFSNLKYKNIMEKYSQVKYIMRGDGENSIPALIKCLENNEEIESVPNLVWRNDDKIICNPISLIELDSIQPIKIAKGTVNVYYESMRGCAFSCKFCSFPMASPKWRFKSASKIVEDWDYYKQLGVKRVKAMDSAFTFPKKRLKQLEIELLKKNIEWEAYSRADIISSPEDIEALENSNCKLLSIGFESLSNKTLNNMDKRITADKNRKANDLLNQNAKKMDFRGSFIVGFPGETPEDFKLTHDFLVNEFKKQFHLSIFSLVDENMPILKEADKYKLVVYDIENPDYGWSHCGMDSNTAKQLHRQTLFDVRWQNEFAVAVEWQLPYDLPLNPTLGFNENYRIEKLIERLAFVCNDFSGDQNKIDRITNSIISELEGLGIFIANIKTNDLPENKRVKVLKNENKKGI